MTYTTLSDAWERDPIKETTQKILATREKAARKGPDPGGAGRSATARREDRSPNPDWFNDALDSSGSTDYSDSGTPTIFRDVIRKEKKKPRPPPMNPCRETGKHLETCAHCRKNLEKVVEDVVQERMADYLAELPKPKTIDWKDVALIAMGGFIILIIICLFLVLVMKSSGSNSR